MIKDTNTKSKKSNNTLYYTAFSLSALSSCAAIVILTIAPYVEFLAPVIGFANPLAFAALAIILTISVFAILYKAFSKNNTISQEAQPEVVEKCDNAEQPAVVAKAQQIPDGMEVEQPVVVASAPHEPVSEMAAGKWVCC